MQVAFPIVFAVFSWWVSTGVILWLINRPLRMHAGIGQVATALMFAATVAIVLIRDQTDLSAAYIGFMLGIVSWAWHEIMFLLGFISGPRKTPLPNGLSGPRRFRASAEALLHHEAAIGIHGVLLTLLSIGAENMVPVLTYYALWGMRLTAKLLIFFGAPNVAEHFLPHKLRYLGSYFRKSSNPTAAFCALAATSCVAAGLSLLAFGAPPGGFNQTVFVLLTTLVGLAVFEHLALVIRIPDQALWSWALKPAYDTSKSKVSPRSTER